MRLFSLAALTLLIACASGPEKTPTPIFADVIARAHELREKGNTDKAQYENLVNDIARIRKETPEYKTEGGNAKLAAEFMAKFPAVSCGLEIHEPNESLSLTGGFTSPLILTTSCPISSPFTFEADSDDLALAPAGFTYDGGTMVAKIRVNSATNNRKKNVLRFSAQYYAAPFLTALRADFDSVENSIIALNPLAYTLTAKTHAPEGSNDIAKVETRSGTARIIHAEKEGLLPIDDKNIVMKISFRAGSIQLSKPIRKQLIDQGFKPGQKIRISGFGEAKLKKAERLANLRARVVASFLAEAVGDIETTVQWSGKPHDRYTEGALIETVP